MGRGISAHVRVHLETTPGPAGTLRRHRRTDPLTNFGVHLVRLHSPRSSGGPGGVGLRHLGPRARAGQQGDVAGAGASGAARGGQASLVFDGGVFVTNERTRVSVGGTAGSLTRTGGLARGTAGSRETPRAVARPVLEGQWFQRRLPSTHGGTPLRHDEEWARAVERRRARSSRSLALPSPRLRRAVTRGARSAVGWLHAGWRCLRRGTLRFPDRKSSRFPSCPHRRLGHLLQLPRHCRGSNPPVCHRSPSIIRVEC